MRKLIFAILVLCGALQSACASLTRPAPSTIWLGLDPPPPSEKWQAVATSLVVSPFSASTPFQTTRIATLTGPSTWDYSRNHRWVAEPGEVIAQHVREHLQKTGLFRAVLSGSAPFDPEYRLGGAAQALYWDRERGSAVVEVEFSLAAYPDLFAGFWVYRSRRPLVGEGIEAFLQAASLALSDILGELTKTLAETVPRVPKPNRAAGLR